jgi:hypothetical protein
MAPKNTVSSSRGAHEDAIAGRQEQLEGEMNSKSTGRQNTHSRPVRASITPRCRIRFARSRTQLASRSGELLADGSLESFTCTRTRPSSPRARKRLPKRSSPYMTRSTISGPDPGHDLPRESLHTLTACPETLGRGSCGLEIRAGIELLVDTVAGPSRPSALMLTRCLGWPGWLRPLYPMAGTPARPAETQLSRQMPKTREGDARNHGAYACESV